MKYINIHPQSVSHLYQWKDKIMTGDNNKKNALILNQRYQNNSHNKAQ